MFRGVKGNRERFPSGQREQTVNLPAMPSKVRILPSPPYFANSCAGIAQLVERKPSKLGVAGSSPVSRSIFIDRRGIRLMNRGVHGERAMLYIPLSDRPR